jgi:hypothetical protein
MSPKVVLRFIEYSSCESWPHMGVRSTTCKRVVRDWALSGHLLIWLGWRVHRNLEMLDTRSLMFGVIKQDSCCRHAQNGTCLLFTGTDFPSVELFRVTNVYLGVSLERAYFCFLGFGPSAIAGASWYVP